MIEDRLRFRGGYENHKGSYEMLYSDPLFPHIFWQIANKTPFDTPIMQCTGLKDKNGNLAYEGDIIKSVNCIYFLSWEEGAFIRTPIIGKAGIILSVKTAEIIGNLYEHPDRLILMDAEFQEVE